MVYGKEYSDFIYIADFIFTFCLRASRFPYSSFSRVSSYDEHMFVRPQQGDW